MTQVDGYLGVPAETYELTVSTAAVGFSFGLSSTTVGVDPPIVAAQVTMDGGPIRVTESGTDPEDDFGHLIAADSSFDVVGPGAVNGFRGILDASAPTDAVLTVTLYQ